MSLRARMRPSAGITRFPVCEYFEVAIGIRASYSNRKTTVAIYGVPILEDGVTWSLESEKVEELDTPEPTYEEDPTLAPGTEVVKKAGTKGKPLDHL